MKLLFTYLKPYKKFVLLAPILMMIEVGSEILMPKLMTKIINVGIANNNFAYIGKIAILMVFLAILGVVGGIGCLIAASIASQKMGRDIRKEIFIKVQAFSFSNIDKFKPSSLITRLTNDITQVQMVALMSLRLLVRAPLLSIGSIFMAASINLKLTLVFLIMIPVVVGVMAFIIKKGFPLFQLVQEKLDTVNTVMRENLSGVRVVKAFVRGDYEKEKFKTVNEDYKDTTIKAFRVVVFMMPSMMLILNLATIAILWFGGLQVQQGTIQIGDIMAFITYLTQILMSLMMIAMVFMTISRAEVSSERISEVLSCEIDIKDPENPIEKEIERGNVVFKNVSFRYEGGSGDPVLENISFEAKSGETIAILGETGSGKSTLVNLMPRLYDTTEGEVLIDGVNVKDYHLKNLRQKVAVVLQEAILFSGTIRDNIKWGKEDATEEEVIAAAKAAQAHDFIMNLPQQYDTELGQKGVNVSGGQKQRISIARALIKNPAVIIFDDSTSAVDMVTEKKIQKAMRESKNQCTQFIIAQRISSVSHADKILVLSGGKIVAEGNHKTLMETSKDYQEIYYSQMRKGETMHE